MRIVLQTCAGLLAKIALGIALSILCATARAEPSSDAPPSAAALALKKGDEGMALYAAEQWDAAFQAMTEADALYHSPVFLLYQARSARNAGHLLQAQAIYRRLIAEPIDVAAPDPWKHAQADARTELATLEQDIPSIVIAITGASERTTVTLDGAPAPRGQRIELDPGSHVLVASDGARRDERAFEISSGTSQQRMVLTLPQIEPAPEHTRQPVAVPAPRERGPYVPGIIVAAAGGAALFAGAIVGSIAHARAADVIDHLPAQCVGKTCLPSVKPSNDARLETPRTLAGAADALFIGGAALAVVGVTLWALDPRGEPPVQPKASIGGAMIQVRF